MWMCYYLNSQQGDGCWCLYGVGTRLNLYLSVMGIDGLLKNLKTCMREKNLEEFRGQKAAVDTYAWLHKIIKSQCGRQIITGKDPTRYISDCMRRVDKITKAGVQLILVFDGGALPRKINEQQARRKRREESFEKGKELIEKSSNIELGLKKMADAIDVSPDVAYKLIEELKIRNIEFIVAPYEADAQLAYLNRVGIVDFIITEDSDLLAFGAKKILYKLDFINLNGLQVTIDSIKEDKAAGFNWFTHSMFLTTCVMAGCDYLDQIKGVGMKLAQKIVGKNNTLKRALAEISQTKQIPPNYEQNFLKALLTFRFQRVYCPKRRECVSINEMNLRELREGKVRMPPESCSWAEEVWDLSMMEYALNLPLDEDHEEWEFLGRKLSKDIAIKVAEGNINPTNFQDYDQDCLEKLRYKKDLNLSTNTSKSQKNSQTVSVPSGNMSILKFCRPIEKKNPLDYRSLRSINDDEYTVFSKEDKPSSMFPVENVWLQKKKKPLKFVDDDEESENESRSHRGKVFESADAVSESQIVSQSQPLLSSDSYLKPAKSEAQKTTHNRLQEISEECFGQIFSEEFLKAPFSF